MQLPEELQTKIDLLIQGTSLKELTRDTHALSLHYREQRSAKPALGALSSDKQHLAYLTTRLPATYAVVTEVLRKLAERLGAEPPTSCLDVGAGPGTAYLAAQEMFPSLTRATLVERDEAFVRLGKQLLPYSPEIHWVHTDLTTPQLTLPASDLVIASYSLGELTPPHRAHVLSHLWSATTQFLVLIEPGTPFAFAQIKQMRDQLLSNQAHLLLPCPHAAECPLSHNDWCHFATRIERSSFHRKAKAGHLNYEDEKFSYLVFSKAPLPRCESRIIRRPVQGTGHIKLQVCSTSGVQEKIILKKNKDSFRSAKKIKWGDSF